LLFLSLFYFNKLKRKINQPASEAGWLIGKNFFPAKIKKIKSKILFPKNLVSN